MKQENDDPPLSIEMAMIILTAIMFLAMGIIIGSSFTQVKKCRSQKAISTTSMSILQDNTLLTYSNPNTLDTRILACRGGDIMKANITMYNSLRWQTDDTPFITANGTRVRKGIIACNWLKFGTIVKIKGNYYEVEDRMNERYGKPYIDIWSSSLKEARQFGRQKLEVEIIR